MIAREWKCKCPNTNKANFIEYLYKTGVNEASKISGFLGFQIFSRDTQGKSEITLITFWDKIESIKAFSGEDEDIDVAKLYPEDYKFDIEPELSVKHYSVIDACFQNLEQIGDGKGLS
jgi:heme-degrading monooxygenase HmoA